MYYSTCNEKCQLKGAINLTNCASSSLWMVYAHGRKSVYIPPFYTRDGTLSQALLFTFQRSLYLRDPHPLILLASLLFTLYVDLCRLHMLVYFLNEL